MIGIDRTDGVDATAFALLDMRKPITNADRIRAMSDYDLADFLCETIDNCLNFGSKGKCPESCPLYKCCNDQPTDNIEGWLKSPITADQTE